MRDHVDVSLPMQDRTVSESLVEERIFRRNRDNLIADLDALNG